MPYIPFYADEKDCKYIRKFLNQHPEVAFIISDGPHRWRATKSVLRLKADTCLWHIPSGPLPLLHPHPSNRIDSIHDPWNGWKELSPGADRDSPYFGPGHPGVIWLNHQPRAWEVLGGIGMSSFEWIGSRYARVGNPVKKTTKSFWNSLRQWVKASATLIPRKGRLNGPNREIWAFPSALAAFKSGKGRDSNPW